MNRKALAAIGAAAALSLTLAACGSSSGDAPEDEATESGPVELSVAVWSMDQTPEFQARWAAGPRGVVTFFSNEGMGAKLGQTFVYFLVASFCIDYLATIAAPGAAFKDVFRFVSTAGFLTFFTAIVPHAIWFKVRIVGHLIESIAYAAIIGAIFSAMWPAAA